MKAKKKIIVVVLLSIIVILGVTFIAFLFQLNINSINENDYNVYIASEERLMEIEKGYLNDNGFVPKEDVPALINEVEIEVKNQLNNGRIQEYNRDTNNIYIKYKSGIEYVFVPHEENALASGEDNNIITLEPNQDDYSVGISRLKAWIDKKFNNLAYQGSYSVPANAKLISDKYPDKFTYNENPMPDYNTMMDDEFSSFTNSRVTVERLKRIGDYKVVIFEGHGNNNESTHSIIFTGESFIGWKDFSKYKEDIARGEVILSSFPTIGNVPYSVVRTYGVTSKFFERHISKMANTLVFLGSCRSGKDRVLADTFLSKGASAVLGFDESVSMEFEMIARSMFFYNLTNEDISVVEAYNRTVNRIGRDNELEHAGLVYFDKDYSASNYTLSGNNPPSIEKEELNKDEPLVVELDDKQSSDFKSGNYLVNIENKIICAKSDGVYFKENIESGETKIANEKNVYSLMSDGETIYFVEGYDTTNYDDRYTPKKVYKTSLNSNTSEKVFQSDGYIELIGYKNDCIYYLEQKQTNSFNQYAIIKYNTTDSSKTKLTTDWDGTILFPYILGEKLYAYLKSNDSNDGVFRAYDLSTGKYENIYSGTVSSHVYHNDDRIVFDTFNISLENGSSKDNHITYTIEKDGTIKKSPEINVDCGFEYATSDGKYGLYFSTINSREYNLYTIDLETGEVFTSKDEARNYIGKNYDVTHDLVHPENIYFMHYLKLYDPNTKTAKEVDCEKYEIDITKPMWIIDGYIVDSEFNNYKIFDKNTTTNLSSNSKNDNDTFDYSSGTFSSNDTPVIVTIEEISNGKIVFHGEKGGQNKAYFPHAEGYLYDGNKLDFETVDSWGSKYRGHLTLHKDSIDLSMKLTEKSKFAEDTIECNCKLTKE